MTRNIPNDRLFSKEHEWVKFDNRRALMGISDHAQSALGDVVYVELPKVGTTISKGMPVGIVESVKAVSDIYAPISGVIKEINQQAINDPAVINSDPYGAGWLMVIEVGQEPQEHDLLDAEGYYDLLNEEEK